jgi:hypothetical protein
MPEDVERRFLLTSSEIAGLVGRIGLIDSWHAAAPPGQSNGHGAKRPEAIPEPAPASRGDSAGSRSEVRRPALPDNDFTVP